MNSVKAFLDQITQLHVDELYEDMIILTRLALTFSDNNPEPLSHINRFKITCLQGEAYFQCREYFSAINSYKNALVLKGLIKCKTKKISLDFLSEQDIRYRLYECHMFNGDHEQALTYLEAIPTKLLTPKMNLALGKLLQKLGKGGRLANGHYKEVLKNNVTSFSAIEGLLSMGIKFNDIEDIIRSSSQNALTIDFLITWIEGHSKIHGEDYKGALSSFQLLDSPSCLQNSLDFLSSVAMTHYLSGNYSKSEKILAKIHSMDTSYYNKMDIYAYLLYRSKKVKELDALSNYTESYPRHKVEPWIVSGFSQLNCNGPQKGLLFGNKATLIDKDAVEGYILKGLALMELNHNDRALACFVDATKAGPNRYEPYYYRTEIYWYMSKKREALSVATEYYKKNQSARSLYLYASFVAKDPRNYEKAKPFLERSLSKDPELVDSLLLLARIYKKTIDIKAAITLLEKYPPTEQNSRYFKLLGRLEMKSRNRNVALDHLIIAKRLDPKTCGETSVQKPGEGDDSDLNELSDQHDEFSEDDALEWKF